MHERYETLREALEERISSDSRIVKIIEKIRTGNASFGDTAHYSEIVSLHLAKVMQSMVGNVSDRAAWQTVCEMLLKDHYESINRILGQVQTAIDAQCGIHIRPQKAAFPTERVRQIAHSLVDPTVAAEVILRRAGAPVANAAKSMHDDYMKENARFRSDAGLKCHIVRTTDGKCCKWCTAMAGRYVYGEEPQDVYRRHDNCGCTVIYESGRQRQDVWSKKSWEVKDTPKKAQKPTRLDHEQAREIERRNLQYRGLIFVSRNGIIGSE